MVSPFAPRQSSEPAPSYQAKDDTKAMITGEKISQTEANYTQAPYGSKDRCSECKFYQRPDQKDSPCSRVVGVVSADGICDLFEKGQAVPAKPATTIQLTIKI